MESNIWFFVSMALSVLLIFLILVLIGILHAVKKEAYVGEIKILNDPSDNQTYMLLVIERGREHVLKNGQIVRLKIVEGIGDGKGGSI